MGISEPFFKGVNEKDFPFKWRSAAPHLTQVQ